MALTVDRSRLGGSLPELRAELREDPNFALAEKIVDRETAVRRRLREIREEGGMTHAQLAERFGESDLVFIALEAERFTSSATFARIATVADVLGYDAEIVFRKKK